MFDIGITLRKYRDREKYTQQYVANYIGISRVAYRKWENNEIDFSISKLLKVTELYGITMQEIMSQSYQFREY